LDFAVEKVPEVEVDTYVEKRIRLFEMFPNAYHSQKLSSLGFDHDRLLHVMDKAHEHNCKILIDSEDKTVQDVIDTQTNSLLVNGMDRGYRDDCVFKTYQMYRKDMLEKLMDDLVEFRSCGLTHNIKLVRGAYITSDHDIIHDTKEATDTNYNKAVLLLLKLAKNNNKVNVIFATHNEESIRLFKDVREPNIHHAFLMGMENPTWLEDPHEFRTNKMVHIPFGPIAKTYPYLLRRLVENNPYTDMYVNRLRKGKKSVGGDCYCYD
jgi:proline dehydrogenase/carbapenem biosynthesis protein (putative proline dehydrogenase)